jgi:hypothetical protein
LRRFGAAFLAAAFLRRFGAAFLAAAFLRRFGAAFLAAAFFGAAFLAAAFLRRFGAAFLAAFFTATLPPWLSASFPEHDALGLSFHYHTQLNPLSTNENSRRVAIFY